MSVSSSSPSSAAAVNPTALPWWGRIETIWLLLPALCTVLFALCQTIAPNDLWYHVRAGEFLSRFGHIPSHNGMSMGVPLNTPYYYQSWIAEGILYQTLKSAGLGGLQILRALCLGGGWSLISLSAYRFLRHERAIASLPASRAVALATIWGFVISTNNVDIRPQTFSVLLFGVWLWALNEFFISKNTRTIALWGMVLVGLTTLWANTHGAFVICLISLGALTFGMTVERRKNEAVRGVLLLVLCALAVCLNPHGVLLYRYLLELSSNPIGQKYIQEWQSPRFDEWHSIVFFLSAPLCLFVVWNEWRRNRHFSPWLWVVGAMWVMGMRDIRAITWFAEACPLLLSLGLAALMSPKVSQETVKPLDSMPTNVIPTRATALINAVVLILLAVLPLGLLPSVKTQWPWPAEFRARFAPTPQRVFPGSPPLLLERTTAVETVEYLIAHPPRQKVFTDMVCGSYMTWASHPQVLPWCDPRIELFPTEFWEDYVRLTNGPSDAAQELERRGFSDALLDSELEAPLIRRLQESGRWKIVARGGKTILFRNF